MIIEIQIHFHLLIDLSGLIQGSTNLLSKIEDLLCQEVSKKKKILNQCLVSKYNSGCRNELVLCIRHIYFRKWDKNIS